MITGRYARSFNVQKQAWRLGTRSILSSLLKATSSSRLERVVQIVTIIEGVALKAHALALNRTVQAARVGKQGIG
jgi:methyl-accepting chemotaxis protein